MKRIALLGFGTVGSGVYEVVERNKNIVSERFGLDIEISHILVRNKEKYAAQAFSEKITSDFNAVLSSSPDIVVEVMGGIEPAYTYIRACLENEIDVVTANKDLIAEHGQELLSLASKHSVSLLYDASVGGGIPILKPLQECLGGNRIDSIAAVINGTTNFILSKMYAENMDYAEALYLAQERGFAEADPTSDVQGYDAVRKLAILSSIAYGQDFKWSDMPTIGITDIDSEDIECAKDIGATIKLLAYSEYKDNNLYASVRPVIIYQNDPIALIENEYNAVILNGDAVGELMFYGKGAGKLPTASAVYGDILDIIQNKKENPQTELKSDAVIQKTWHKPAKWLVRLMGQHKNDIIPLLLEQFASQELRIQTTAREDEVHAIVRTASERELQEKLDQITDHSSVYKAKYFLVYR